MLYGNSKHISPLPGWEGIKGRVKKYRKYKPVRLATTPTAKSGFSKLSPIPQ
jgi:hypothetical protein